METRVVGSDVLRSFARRIDQTDPGAQNNLGVFYFRRGMFDEATAAFSRALALDERMGVARRNLEIAFGETGTLERRVAELEARLRESPEDVGALVESGIAEKAAGRLDQAERKFRRALEHDPDSSVLHFFLAEIFYNRGLGEEALRCLRRSIDINPANPDAHFLAGFILGDLGRIEEAREANRRAVALNPRLSRAEANLSLEAGQAGELQSRTTPGGAFVVDDSAKVASSPRLTLALALRLKGYHVEAKRECQAAVDAGENPSGALEALASLNLLSGRHAKHSMRSIADWHWARGRRKSGISAGSHFICWVSPRKQRRASAPASARRQNTRRLTIISVRSSGMRGRCARQRTVFVAQRAMIAASSRRG